MAYYITNGAYFIRINQNGGIKKTAEQTDATKFISGEDAEMIIKMAPAKTKGYQVISMNQSDETLKSESHKNEELLKRKKHYIYKEDIGKV